MKPEIDHVRRWRPHDAVVAALVALAFLAIGGARSFPASAAAPGTPSTPAARLTVTATPTPTPTAPATPDAVDECIGCLPPTATTLTDLNVRRGPGVDYAVLGYLRAGQAAAVVGINGDGTWLQIVYPPAPDDRGWIARRYVEVHGDLASVPAVVPPTPEPTVTPTITPTPAPTETAVPAAEPVDGWLGEYFDNLYLQGPPVVVRIDPVIDFNWADRAPAPGMPADDFSVRWTRVVEFREGTYRFVVEVDDGVRLWVGDRLIIDEWRDTRPTSYVAELAMSAGPQPVRLEYYEHLANAMIRFTWHRPEDWRARYYDNRRLQGDPVLERWEEEINHDWGTGSPNPVVPADNFSARWTARVNFRESRYVFNVEVDDGVRLWVDGDLVIDSWLEGVRTLRAERYFLSRGDRTVRVEYFERWGNARIRVWWERK
jgi:hypothetical protein